jgi:alkanesulfonate monooxygenase SsuD/methylene tetrahydromethanopterin reductase-like flavin-dependent oxidoreductase (luciferase family)
MQYGFVLPGGDARVAADLASLAERSGWDGFFVCDSIWSLDAYVTLAAAAMRTESIRLGTLLTPLPRRLPWDLASQTATLDDLSNGRLILSIGLGALHAAWTAFERDEGRRTRVEKLDEGLDILGGLWAGQPFSYQGKHYQVHAIEGDAPPPPPATVQKPRIKTWVVGAWPHERSMRRAARFDGWLPNYLPPEGPDTLTPEVLHEGVAWLQHERGGNLAAYDVVVEGNTFRTDASVVGKWAAAGATWWIEANWLFEGPLLAYAEERLAAGPPRF